MDDSYPFSSPTPTRASQSQGEPSDRAGYRFSRNLAWKTRSVQPAPTPVEHPFEFTGTASQYFRIWIVNVALTLVTFGIYSAWAKVRTRKYILQHTKVAGHGLDYHATPLSVLKGRVLIVACLGVLGIAHAASPILYVLGVFVLALLAPWMIAQSLRFNARNTSYRNIRFGFIGRTGDAYRFYLGYQILSSLTLGMMWPFVQRDRANWRISHHTWGDQHFAFDCETRPYTRVALLAVASSVTMFVAFSVLAWAIETSIQAGGTGSAGPTAAKAAIFLTALPAYGVLLSIGVWVATSLSNIAWNHTTLETHRFRANLSPTRVLWLLGSGLVASACSFGLLMPWAHVRYLKYRMSCLTLITSGPLKASRDELAEQGHAFADAAHDIGELDLDMGL